MTSKATPGLYASLLVQLSAFVVENSYLSFESTFGGHHLHYVFSFECSCVNIVNSNNQITREEMPFQTASSFNRVDSRSILRGLDDDLQLSGRSVTIATYNTLHDAVGVNGRRLSMG